MHWGPRILEVAGQTWSSLRSPTAKEQSRGSKSLQNIWKLFEKRVSTSEGTDGKWSCDHSHRSTSTNMRSVSPKKWKQKTGLG